MSRPKNPKPKSQRTDIQQQDRIENALAMMHIPVCAYDTSNEESKANSNTITAGV